VTGHPQPATTATENEHGKDNSNNGRAEALPKVINGLHIIQREDCKYVVLDPTKKENNTLAICNEIEEAVAAAEKKKPERAQFSQADSSSA
jgi:hypothetical protein